MHIAVNVDSGVPIYLQIASQIREIAAAGGLGAGDRLPSVRQLAVRLRVNPNTIQAAYRHLESEGVVETRQGLGVFVNQVERLSLRERLQAASSALDQAVLKAMQKGLDDQEISRLFDKSLKSQRKKVEHELGKEGLP